MVTVCASGGEEVGGDSKEEGPGESAAVGGAPDKVCVCGVWCEVR